MIKINGGEGVVELDMGVPRNVLDDAGHGHVRRVNLEDLPQGALFSEDLAGQAPGLVDGMGVLEYPGSA